MSFNRVKNTTMQGSKLEKNSMTSGIAKPTAKKSQNLSEKPRQQSPMRLTPKLTPPHRSLSQPSSSTTLTRQNYRPSSGGDEKTVLVSKFNQNRMGSEHSEDEDCESIQYYKDNVEPYSDRKNSDDIESKYSNSVKASASGIPLRIKSITTTPKIPTRKTTSRLTKQSSQVSHLPGRGGAKTTLNDSKAAPTTSLRVLEMQFQTKKKKFDQLKKDVIDKQNGLIEVHRSLVPLQKKLEESGRCKSLMEDFKVLNFIDLDKVRSTADGVQKSTSSLAENKQLDPELVHKMKDTVKQIPFSLFQVCKKLLDKRLNMIDVLRRMSTGHSESDITDHVESLKKETATLDSMVEEEFAQQEKHVGELVDKWQILLQGNGNFATFSDHIEQLQEKLKDKDQKLTEVLCEMQSIRKKSEEEGAVVKAEVNILKDKIKSLEKEQSQDKALVQDHKDKNNMLEQKFKILKSRGREVDQNKRDTESKYNELVKQHRQVTEQLKSNEQKWAKEKEEILTKNKHDRQMLDKLTKDRSYFETRVKTLEELAEDWENKYKNLEEKAFTLVEEARKAMTEEVVNRETMQQKYDNIKDQLVQMEIRRKQAIDLINTKNTFEPNETDGISTEREAELYTELLATRVALKSAEEQIQNYNREKLRFIDSLQTLDESSDGNYVTTTLVKSVERLTELESKLAKSEEMICIQKIEIAGLKVDSDSLKERSNIALCNMEASDAPSKDNELKKMLHEGRIKLEHSLKKSLEYEHRIIKYEHEMNKQSNQIIEMQNLVKVRDGLISILKAKKDELQMENDSLNKYGNEIRELLLLAKEEANNRTDLVNELSTNLDTRGRICQQWERKIKELEGLLAVTNEKRFKLQDALGVMEKELQTTKAHIIKLSPDIKSRYGIDITEPDKVYSPDLPQRDQPFNNPFNPQVRVLVEPPINNNFQLPTEYPVVIPSESLYCCNFISDGKNVVKINRTPNIFDNLEDMEKGLNNLNVALEPYSNTVLSSQVSNQLVKDKPNYSESCGLNVNSLSKCLVNVTFQNKNNDESSTEQPLSKLDAKSKNLNMKYKNSHFSSDEICKSSQKLIQDKQAKLSVKLGYPETVRNNDIEDCGNHHTGTRTTVKEVKYRIRNLKNSGLLLSSPKKLKKVYDHIVGESNSKSSGVFKCESITKRKRKYAKKSKIPELVKPQPDSSKPKGSGSKVSMNIPNTYARGHSCNNHELPVELYLHCHHGLNRNDSSSSNKTIICSTGSKPCTPLQRDSSDSSTKTRTDTLSDREGKRPFLTKPINPILIERTNFINHARKISRHFANLQTRVRLIDLSDDTPTILRDKNENSVSINSISFKSMEMEDDRV